MSIKVLLVDDEKAFVDLLSERIGLRGFSVGTALNGEEALDKIEAEGFDVVILDVAMPGMGGIETLREIKARQPLLQVIMHTSNTTVSTAVEGMKLGAYDYLIKPSEIDELVEKIKGAHAIKNEHEERIKKAEVDAIAKTRAW